MARNSLMMGSAPVVPTLTVTWALELSSALVAVSVKVVVLVRFVAIAIACPVTSLSTKEPPSRVTVSASLTVQLKVALPPSATTSGVAVKLEMMGTARLLGATSAEDLFGKA